MLCCRFDFSVALLHVCIATYAVRYGVSAMHACVVDHQVRKTRHYNIIHAPHIYTYNFRNIVHE